MQRYSKSAAGVALLGGGVGPGAPQDEGGDVSAKGSRANGQQQQPQEGWGQPQLQRVVPQLSTGPFLRALELLPPQDRACSGRLACRDAWRHLSGVHHRTARLSQPLPPHAVPWFERYGPDALKQLTFNERQLQPMCAAAASGSEANLAAVWGMVRQGFLPEQLECYQYIHVHEASHPSSVLVREGHAHLLPWFMNSGYPIYPDAYDGILCTAAHHCDLAGLQAVWQVMQPHFHRIPTPDLTWGSMLSQAAASCAKEDAIAKVSWLMQQGPYRPMGRMPKRVALAAVRVGDIPRLQWALQQGCDLGTDETMDEAQKRFSDPLPIAMRHAGLDMVEWLMREAGCQLPPPLAAEAAVGDAAYPPALAPHGVFVLESLPREVWTRRELADAAAESGDVAKLRWLRDRGLLPLEPYLAEDVLKTAARQGRLEALRYLHEECGQRLTRGVVSAAVCSGDMGTAAWVLQQGGRELLECRRDVWVAAAVSGNGDLLRWMVGQGMVGAGEGLEAVHAVVAAGRWSGKVRHWRQRRDSLMSAVHLVLEAAGDGSSSGGGDGSGDGRSSSGGGDGSGDGRSSGGGGNSSGGGGGDGNGGSGVGGRRAAGSSGYNQALAEKVLVAAAKRGMPHLFTYLHSQLQLQLQGPLGSEVLLEAARSGCEALVEWLLGHGCAIPEHIGELFLTPAWIGDLKMIRCLRRMGLPWPDRLLPEAVRIELPLPMLQWLAAEGMPTGEGDAMEAMGRAIEMENERTGRIQEERDVSGLEMWLLGLGWWDTEDEWEALEYTESEGSGDE